MSLNLTNANSLVSQFEKQVLLTPKAIAIKTLTDEITFEALHNKIEIYAYELSKLGVKERTFVGIFLPRNIDMIICQFAILYLEAAYIPLDINYPKNHTQRILDDAQCEYILTNELYTDCFKIKNVIDIKKLTSKITSSDKNVFRRPSPSSIAYIIYTSGSTGYPKGVMITHENAFSFLSWAQSVYPIHDREGMLAATSICFDLSIFEIFLPLLFGGTVHLVEDIFALDKLPASFKINLINTVPSAVDAILSLNQLPLSVKTVNLAGEVLRQKIVNKLYALNHVEKVYNLYAPSETTTYSTIHLCKANEKVHNVPIGKAIDGTKIFIVDKYLNLMPFGNKGEIVISGKGVAQGYWNRSNETNQRFITHCFDGINSIRVYKTGDLGRMLPNKIVEFFGRIDTQVKVRGYRIELADIEARILKHPDINNVVVGVDEENILTAYYTTFNKNDNEIRLQDFLTDEMPLYMIPNRFIKIQKFPMLANGKIDRQVMVKQRQVLRDPTKPNLMENNPVLTELIKLWQELLPFQPVTPYDDFFQLGGHSLLATQLVSRIRKNFQCNFPLEIAFTKTTPILQCHYIEKIMNNNQLVTSSISEQPVNKIMPLSYAQQRMWFLECMEPLLTISNVPCLLRLKGSINASLLQAVLNKIIERHKTLRTCYKNIDGEPIQLIQELKKIIVSQQDLTGCTDSEIHQFIYHESRKRFDFNTELLLRANLIQIKEGIYYLLLTFHHLSVDAWSISIFAKEFCEIYGAYKDGKEPLLPVVVDYVKYSAWQQQYMTPDALRNTIDYWKTQLHDANSKNPLKLDKPRPTKLSYEGEFFLTKIPNATCALLKDLCANEKITLFMTLLSAYYLLLHCYSNESDICVGTPIANRRFKEIENTIGFFVNTLVLRAQIDKTMTIRTLLQQIKKITLEAYEHQDLPFEKLVEELNHARNNQTHPLFQIFFTLQNSLNIDFNLSGIEVEAIDFDRGISKFDITFSLQDNQDHLALLVEYSTDLFYRQTIEKLASCYVNILQQMTLNLDKRIEDIDLVSSSVYNKIIHQWNNIKENNIFSKNFINHFEEIVSQYPHNVAIIEDTKEITYRQLNERANQLARYLVMKGVAPNIAIGVYLDRSINLIVSLLAVQKVGCYYVPIASGLPEERISFILADASIHLVIVTSDLEKELPIGDYKIVDLIEESTQIAMHLTDNIARNKLPNTPFYVVYTSGTSGQPKGVLAPEKGVIRLVKEPNYIAINKESVVLQISPISFDGATFEIWGPLLNGGKLVLMPSGIPELQTIASLIKRHAVNTMFVTTQLFNSLVDYKLDVLTRVSTLLFGGESASVHHVKKFKQYNNKTKLLNMYGPTEATTFTAFYSIEGLSDEISDIAIGRPVSNTQIYILDSAKRVVPANEIGEIYIGGEGIAYGYLNQEELTKKYFIEHSFQDNILRRLYRSGDRAFFDHLGCIHFVGREDDQIKRHGYRIELGEINAHIRAYPKIRDCYTYFNQQEDTLRSYVLCVDPNEKDLTQLKSWLTHRLPTYMIPDAVISVKELPININGKVDRIKLLQLIDKKKQSFPITVENESLESLIGTIWQKVLQHDDFDSDDNFFDIGGHSLRMVHVLELLTQSLKNIGYQQIPDMVELFTYPTISLLAQFIRENNQPQSDLGAQYYANKQKIIESVNH